MIEYLTYSVRFRKHVSLVGKKISCGPGDLSIESTHWRWKEKNAPLKVIHTLQSMISLGENFSAYLKKKQWMHLCDRVSPKKGFYSKMRPFLLCEGSRWSASTVDTMVESDLSCHALEHHHINSIRTYSLVCRWRTCDGLFPASLIIYRSHRISESTNRAAESTPARQKYSPVEIFLTLWIPTCIKPSCCYSQSFSICAIMMLAICVFLLFISPVPAPPTDGQTRVLSESFSSPTLNTTLWNYGYPWGSYYTHRANTTPRQVRVTADGLLNITATRERSINQGIWTEYGPIDLDFSSGAVNTDGKFCIKNGYVEISVRVPETQSTWPTVFLVPDNQGQVPMLTVMEVFDARTRYSYGFKYTNDQGSVEEMSAIAQNRPTSDAVHRYGVDWGYDQITWYYDDKWVNTITKSNELKQVNNMCLVIGLGVGGKSKETPVDPRAYPSIMSVNLLEIWQPKYDGFYKFQNVQTGLLLEIDSASHDSGAKVLQWYDNGGDWQVSIVSLLKIERHSGRIVVVDHRSGTNLGSLYDRSGRCNTQVTVNTVWSSPTAVWHWMLKIGACRMAPSYFNIGITAVTINYGRSKKCQVLLMLSSWSTSLHWRIQ